MCILNRSVSFRMHCYSCRFFVANLSCQILPYLLPYGEKKHSRNHRKVRQVASARSRGRDNKRLTQRDKGTQLSFRYFLFTELCFRCYVIVVRVCCCYFLCVLGYVSIDSNYFASKMNHLEPKVNTSK